MILVTPASLSVSTFCSANAWNTYSLPIRRAGSPVQASRGPRMAKSTPALVSSFAVASAVLRARSSNEVAQPTQYRYSGAGSPGSSTRTPIDSAQSARSDWALPHGFEARSTSRSIGSDSAGKLDSTITRWRRRSTMWSTCSIDTGHACTQAPQVTQSHTDSSGTASGHQRTRARAAAVAPAARGHDRPAVGEHLVAQAHDHQLGRQHLAGGERRARILAAAALGAGEGVEHLLPGQLGRVAGAEADVLLGDVGIVEAQRLEPPAGPGAPVPDVEGGADDVQMLGARQVGQEEQDRRYVSPDEHPLEHPGDPVVGEQVREQVRHRRRRGRPLVQPQRDPGGVPQQQRDRDRRDQPQDQVGLAEVAALEALRPLDLADPQRAGHADQHQHREQVDQERVPALVAEPRERGVLVDGPDHGDHDRRAPAPGSPRR